MTAACGRREKWEKCKRLGYPQTGKGERGGRREEETEERKRGKRESPL